MPNVVVVKGENYAEMVFLGLSELKINPARRKIVIKPNLIDNRPYPVTTSVLTVEGIARYFLGVGAGAGDSTTAGAGADAGADARADARAAAGVGTGASAGTIAAAGAGAREIIIAEGSGWCSEGTLEAFVGLGYMELAGKYNLKLKDLNEDDYEIIRNPDALVLKEFEYPKTLKDSYLISAAVLKRHSLCKVTLSLKNMLGATIISNKARFHHAGVSESIVDINAYEKPNLAVIDAVTGNMDHELGWKPKQFNTMIFSEDLVAADAVASKLLGVDPKTVKHINLAQERGLGTADLSKINVKVLE